MDLVLKKLKEVIPDNPELRFISDRNQSIGNAVSHVYPMAHHGACMYHIMLNIKSRFENSASLQKFVEAVKAYRVDEFCKNFNDIRQRHLNVAQYLEKNVKFEKWYRAHLKGNRYEVMTTNIVETLNNMMRMTREYSIIVMVDFLIFIMGQWFLTRCRESTPVTIPMTTKREAKLRPRFDEAGKLKPIQLNENEYYVIGDNFNAQVNLRTRSCSCKVFDVEKIPCIHAIAGAGLHQLKDTESYIYSICSEYYHSEYCMLAYAETIYPVPPKSQWDNIPEEIRSIEVLELVVEKVRGRLRLTRCPSQGEFIIKKYKCMLCDQIGHNSRRCLNKSGPFDTRSPVL